ncbi:RDD family protein [Nocardioides sp.]|uniref:RDD family protein n=1 Tax=Nocardioides sp. TaxID=35761 RepID=UPI0026250B0B|nr:RDD family protein [Nocardioides sp.]MDI6909856.1 RDD family protein [Nocardioides sp.]
MTDTAVPLCAPADPDRRFYAFVVDRLVAWTVDAAAGYLVYRTLLARDHTLAGVLVILGTVLLVGALLAVVLGRTGSSPGRAATGTRLVAADDGAPIGVGAALRRQLLLGLATLPTFGLGAATLAWTAMADPGGRRRGWHDRVAGSEVIEVRRAPAEPAPEEPAPRQLVNLTALRLVPVPAAPTPPALPSALPSALPPALPPAPVSAASARWWIGFDSGESLVLEGPALVGRRPEPRAGEPVAHLVALRSEDMSLSKTHAQLHVDAGGALVVVDRGSTNGSILLRQGAARELPAGRPTTLLDGDVVRFGDREMRVDRGAGAAGSVTVR